MFEASMLHDFAFWLGGFCIGFVVGVEWLNYHHKHLNTRPNGKE